MSWEGPSASVSVCVYMTCLKFQHLVSFVPEYYLRLKSFCQYARIQLHAASVGRIRNVGAPGPTQVSRRSPRVRARGGGRRVKSQTHSAAGSSPLPADPATRPEAGRAATAAAARRSPASRPCLPHPSRRSAAQRRPPVRYASGSARAARRALGLGQRTRGKDRAVSAPPDPAPAAAHCSLRVRARAPPGAADGTWAPRGNQRRPQQRACAGFPHAVVRRGTGPRGAPATREARRTWPAQLKETENKWRRRGWPGCRRAGSTRLGSGARVQRVTAAHGSRRGYACCGAQAAGQAGRFRLRFIIGARTFSAQQARQRGGIGILFQTFSLAPAGSLSLLSPRAPLVGGGGKKDRGVPGASSKILVVLLLPLLHTAKMRVTRHQQAAAWSILTMRTPGLLLLGTYKMPRPGRFEV
jgi:hypothetical protein